jgi:predicted nucleic acid-binding protein
MNIFGKKVGKGEAAQAGKALLARHVSGTLTIIPSPETVLSDALDRLQQSQGGSPSFIDCLVMAFADHRHTEEIYGFDETFSKNGYRLPGAAVEEQVA